MMVRGDLFKEGGKWAYTVSLEFLPIDDKDRDMNGTYVPPDQQVRDALLYSTLQGKSGVTFREIPQGWSLVVLEPPFGYPILVTRQIPTVYARTSTHDDV